MKSPLISFPLFLLCLLVQTKGQENDTIPYATPHTIALNRHLMSKLASDDHFFRPLDCNQPDPCKTGRVSWTSQSYNTNRRVVIPCGVCVTMDYPGDRLELPSGIDIQGTLLFPDGYKLILETPFVLVQGVLEMKSTREVTEEPDVRFVMTGTKDNTFTPAQPNRLACTEPGSRTPVECNVGAKAIAVAGGRLDVQGIGQQCTTWVHLEDRIADDTFPADPTSTLPELDSDNENKYCRSYSTDFIDNSFRPVEENRWTGGDGANTRIVPGQYLRTDERQTEMDGPSISLVPFRDCLVANQDYLFSVRVRMISPTTGGLTSCARNGSRCLRLRSVVRFASYGRSRTKGEEERGFGFRYRKWHNFYATVRFEQDELVADPRYHFLRFEGPAKNVRIDIDSVRFYAPPSQVAPTCKGNLISNGNAQSSDIHPYPVERSQRRNVLFVRSIDASRAIFVLSKRKAGSDGLLYHMNPACLQPGARYRVLARIRIKGAIGIQAVQYLRIRFGEQNQLERYTVAKCPPSHPQRFITCRADVILPLELDGKKLLSADLTIETLDEATADVEVDDWSFTQVNGPIRSIVVPEAGVDHCWGEGAEVLITSHTTSMENSQVRRLVSPPSRLDSGLVQLDLDRVIDPPVAMSDGDGFPVEVALLSRNIVFEGAEHPTDSLIGGHLIVFHTADVVQKIVGIELENFGQQGETLVLFTVLEYDLVLTIALFFRSFGALSSTLSLVCQR